jgi:hypothetical protein
MLPMFVPAAMALAFASPAFAQSGCAAAIAAFRIVVDNDVRTGQLNRSVYRRLAPELEAVAQVCRSGRDAEAAHTLAGLKSRYGYH